MRFELEPQPNGSIYGAMRDTWKGVYESRSADGVIDFADVTYQGTFEVSRRESGPSHLDIDKNPNIAGAVSRPLPAPPLEACTAFDFTAVPEVSVNAEDYSCATLSSSLEFQVADSTTQASCAIAMSEHALAGDTTSAQIRAFLDDEVPNPEGLSFAEFHDQVCSPRRRHLCT